MLVAVTFAATPLFGQRGGKAEPQRFELTGRRATTLLAGTLRTGQQAEYVFRGEAGSVVTISNTSPRLFDFRVFSEENFSEGDFDSSPSYTFEIPADGDYLLTIRKKVGGPRSARYRLTVVLRSER
jgi:hypothetical protein